jgi:hypothetical protein
LQEAAAIAMYIELYLLPRFTFIWTRGKKNPAITQPINQSNCCVENYLSSYYLCSDLLSFWVIFIDYCKGSTHNQFFNQLSQFLFSILVYLIDLLYCFSNSQTLQASPSTSNQVHTQQGKDRASTNQHNQQQDQDRETRETEKGV